MANKTKKQLNTNNGVRLNAQIYGIQVQFRSKKRM